MAMQAIHIFLPEKKEDRVKFLNDILEQNSDTFLEELISGAHLLYRQARAGNSRKY